MSPRVTAHASARRFAEQALPLLLRDEALNCLALGVLDRLVSDPARFAQADLFSIDDSTGLLGVAWRTRPHPLGLCQMPEDAAHALADFVAAEIPERLSGVAGPRPAVDRFLDRYLVHRGGRVRHAIAQRIHRLERVTPAERAPGTLRSATPADERHLLDWGRRFVLDCGLPLDEAELARGVAADLARGCRVYWDVDGAAVSMAAFGGQTPSGVRISWVYTPPERRGRGYASALVAALTERLLAEGRTQCFLYTDSNNSTANRLYARIGYRPVGDAAHYELGE